MQRLLLSLVISAGLFVNVAAAGPRDALWRQVDDAIDRGLPQTAIGHLDQIIPGALEDRAHAEAMISWQRRHGGGKVPDMPATMPGGFGG